MISHLFLPTFYKNLNFSFISSNFLQFSLFLNFSFISSNSPQITPISHFLDFVSNWVKLRSKRLFKVVAHFSSISAPLIKSF